MRLLIATATVVLLAIATAPGALGYSPSAAAQYADRWVSNSINLQNPAYRDFGGTDCTNFVSQALFAGGYAMHGVQLDKTSYQNWYSKKTLLGFDVSFTWSVATDLLQFLYYDSPGGFARGYKSPSQAHRGSPLSGGAIGDVLFYDWGAGEGVSHATIQVAHGTDPVSGWVGDLVDEHTTDRYHAFWSLEPYNANRAWATYITVVNIGAGN